MAQAPICLAPSGTDIAYAAICLCLRACYLAVRCPVLTKRMVGSAYAVSRTNLCYHPARSLRDARYTDTAYAPVPGLTKVPRIRSLACGAYSTGVGSPVIGSDNTAYLLGRWDGIRSDPRP
eukprot:3686331-Rhodomonas_salina.2